MTVNPTLGSSNLASSNLARVLARYLLLGLAGLVLTACSSPATPALSLAAADITFEAEEASKALVLTNNGDPGSTLEWSASVSYEEVSYEGTATGWLGVTPASGGTPGGGADTLTLTVDRADLTPGDHEARLTVTSNGGNASVRVLLRVVAPPQLVLSASDLSFDADDVSKTFVLRNGGDPGSTLEWSAAVNYEGAAAGWLGITPASGSTSGGGADTLTLAVDRADLAPGDYQARLTVTSNGGENSIRVRLRVAAPPQPQLGELADVVEFEPDETSVILAIRNSGDAGSALTWRLGVSYQGSASGWLSVDPDSGSTSGGDRRTAALSVDRDGLAPGRYGATLTVSSNGGESSIPVFVNVAAPEPVPALELSATELDFGEGATQRTLSVGNSGEAGSSLQWSANLTYQEGEPDWLSVSPLNGNVAAGDAQALSLTANRTGLAPGDYQARLSVSSNGGSQSVSVRLRVPQPPPPQQLTFSLEPTTLDFGVGSSAATFTLSNTHPRAITWTASVDANWLTLVNPSSAERGEPLAPGAADAVRVSVDRAELEPGSYQATITVRAEDASDANLNDTRTLTVSMRVPATEPPASSSIGGRVTTANAAIAITTAAQGEPETLSTATAAIGLGTDAGMNRPAYAPGELLVRYRQDGLGTLSGEGLYSQSVKTLAEDYALTVLRTGDSSLPDIVALPPGADVEAAATRLEADPRVLFATPNYYVYSQNLPNDPEIQGQWALAASGLPAAWGRETGGTSRVVVAVIDSGFALQHPDLAGRFLPGYDFCANQDCSQTDADPTFGQSQNFHGSHVAGLIGAIGDNGVGISGAAYGNNLRLLPIKVYPDDGSSSPISTLIDALNWAVGIPVTTIDGKQVSNPNPARVINMSLGGNFSMPFALQEAIDNARARGAVIVVAAGNDGAGRVQSPAAAEGVLAVGAHNQAFRRSCFSNFGQPDADAFGPGGLDLLAPGGDRFLNCRNASQGLLSTVPGNDYARAIGTSMAAPMVSAVAALLLSREPSLSVSQLESRLTGSAYFDPSYMNAQEYGAGVLRADRALGLSGPGDSLSVVAEGPSATQATVTLDLMGGSTPYSLNNLRAGAYTLSAGDPASLFGRRQASVGAGQNLEDQTIELQGGP
ncbi:MAG: S8 family serine peptidase [Deinococcota bacterium]|nr:S8 family serine peptidase [Deinococcota bacterium]